MKHFLTHSFVILLLLLPLVTNSVDATSPYVWNITLPSVTWTKVSYNSGMIIGDSTNDGIGDYVYTLSGNTHLTKQFGTGVSSFDISLGDKRGILFSHSNRVLAWYLSHKNTLCHDAVAIQWNVLTGTNITSTKLNETTSLGESLTANLGGAFTGIINKNNQTALICTGTNTGTISLAVHDIPNNNQSITDGAGTNVANNGIFGMKTTLSSTILIDYLYTNVLYTEKNSTSLIRTNATAGLSYPYIDSVGILSNTKSLGVYGSPRNLFIDPQITKYFNGSLATTNILLNNPNGLQSRLLHPQLNSLSLLAAIPPFILNPQFTSLTTPPTYFMLNDGTTDFVAAIYGNTLYYTNFATLMSQLSTNRALANYIIDPSSHFLTVPINGSYSATPITLFLPNGTAITYVAPEQTVLFSGIHWQVPGQTRYYYPDFTNSLAQMPTDTFTSANAVWTIIVSNAPESGAIMFSNSTNYNGTNPYVSSVVFLQSDHSTTTSLVNNACYNTYVDDSSNATPIWLFQGVTCANGVNPKTIAFVNTLPLTFYTMGSAATHSFTPSTNALSTTVRSTTIPFTYTVIVKNSTGSVTINSTFTSNSTIDTRNFNVSSTTKSAGLFISVAGVGQIYSAYLGSPVSLASVASFFHTYFSYQGFDFLSFIPLIFAAMFTRNTVGIGATLTVVLIATLSWLSVVVVSDTIIFIMMVIAILGLVGYRSLYQ